MQSGCIPVADIDCSMAAVPLISALDDGRHTHMELHNAANETTCNDSELTDDYCLAGWLLVPKEQEL